MEYKDVIKTLEIAKAEVEWNYPLDYQIAFDCAIECVEKQVPKRPIEDAEFVGWLIWRCPVCGQEVGRALEPLQHHCECGQAIDWEVR